MYGSLVDVALIILIIVFAVNGYRQGFVIGVFTFVGFFGGAAIGLQLGPLLARLTQSDLARVFISLITIFALAITGQAIAGYFGQKLRAGIRNRTGQTVDDLGGSVVQVVALLLVAWLVAAPLGSAGIPGLARAVRSSAVLHGVDKVMPSQARALSDALRQTVDTTTFPDVFGGLSPTRVRDVPAPNGSLAASRVVVNARASVVKILSSAPSCSRRIEGSGFIYASERVMTNAHVVAGTRTTTVIQGGQDFRAQVVVYDPQRDLAVLAVPGLTGSQLRFNNSRARTGSDAIVLGYPLDGPYNAQSARIRDVGLIRGPNIYNSATVTRDIYTVRGLVRPGNSGGPLINKDGQVLGVIFAAAADDPDTGFALTAVEAGPVIDAGRGATSAVSTGDCADG
ncbi:MAG: MarP family serine protease [Micromonosporaceae bacterium]|nr:MarP family serine protease [Micromonosporaceae bacterium]